MGEHRASYTGTQANSKKNAILPRRSLQRSPPQSEYQGHFAKHPARTTTELSLSVRIPDKPTPLGSVPSNLAHRHDRRRDYFTDSPTLEAALGNNTSDDTGIRYKSLDSCQIGTTTTISLAPSRQTSPPIVRHISAEKKGQSQSTPGSRPSPHFRRARGEAQGQSDDIKGYGPESHVPRFILERMRELNPNNTLQQSTDGSCKSSDSVVFSRSSSCSSSNSTNARSTRSTMQSILAMEEAKLLEAERKNQMKASESILTDEQKVAYVGLVYLILVDMQSRLNVQFKESQSSTASFMNFSRRVMRKLYNHIQISPEEQRMIELLPRHKICIQDMTTSLAAQGDTILIETDQALGIAHTTTEDLINALQHRSEYEDDSEPEDEARTLKKKKKKPIFGLGGLVGGSKKDEDDKSEIYSQYSQLPTDDMLNSNKNVGKTKQNDFPSTINEESQSHILSTSNNEESEPEAEPDEVDSPHYESDTKSIESCKNYSTHNRGGSNTSQYTNQMERNSTAESENEYTNRNAFPCRPGSSSDACSFSDDMIDGEHVTKVDADQTLIIDVRATLVLDLFLLLLTGDVYDSRGRYLLRRIADALNYPWIEVVRCERRVTRQLCLYNYASDVTSNAKVSAEKAAKVRSEKGHKKRLLVIGLATVGGGLVIGLSAGLLAPAIGAGIGATLGAIGVANTGAFFGSIGGTALITGAATLTGSGLAGRQISRRTRFAEQFEFIPCTSDQQTNLVFTIPGWLGKADNGVFSFSTLDPINGDHFSLLWESDALCRLGSSLRMIVGEVFSITVTQTLQHTVLPSLLGPLSVPMWLAKLGYVLDNPWSTCCDLSYKAGPVIADLLLQRVQGQRPVTLIGYSIGARLIFYALLELANMNAYGLVEDVYIFGAPIVASESEWRLAASVVGGRFVNGYSSKDWILSFFYRTTNIGRSSIAGLQPILGINGLENVDFSEDVPGHIAYREQMPLLLSKLGIFVTDTNLHDPNEGSGNSEHDRDMITELEKAAKMLEEHDKKKKKWISRLAFWDNANSDSGQSSQQSPSSASSSGLRVGPEYDLNEANASARELQELGIDLREVEATLPALVVDSRDTSKPRDNTD